MNDLEIAEWVGFLLGSFVAGWGCGAFSLWVRKAVDIA